MAAQEIVDQLNDYDRARHVPSNVWDDVIRKLDNFDEAATADLDPAFSSDRFALTDGTVIRFDQSGTGWYVES